MTETMTETPRKAGRKLPPIESDKHAQHVRADHGTQQDFPVAGQPGLSLRVSADGGKVWTLRYRNASGQQKRLTIGSYPGIGLKDARAKARQIVAAVDGGADPARDKRARREAATVEALADEWVRHLERRGRASSYIADIQSRLARYVLPAIGKVAAGDVRKADVLAILDDAVDAGRSHIPNRLLSLLRAMFRWGLSEDRVDHDPTAGIKARLDEEARERTLSADEIHRAWHGLAEAPMTEGVALAIKLSLATAQRINEVTRARVADFDLTAGVWLIPAEHAKNGEAHRVPLGPLAVELVQRARELAAGSEWLIPGPTGSHVERHATSVAWGRARGALGLDDVRIHDLRRTAATGMAAAGIGERAIAHVLNHISVTRGTVTGKVYIRHEADQEKRHALLTWERVLREMIVGTAASNVVALTSARG